MPAIGCRSVACKISRHDSSDPSVDDFRGAFQSCFFVRGAVRSGAREDSRKQLATRDIMHEEGRREKRNHQVERWLLPIARVKDAASSESVATIRMEPNINRLGGL